MSESRQHRNSEVSPEFTAAVQPLLGDVEECLSRRKVLGREVLTQLESAQRTQARAEVDQLDAIVEFCRLHSVTQDPTDFVEQVMERFSPGGNDGTPSISEFVCCEVAAVLGVSLLSAAGSIREALDLVYRHPRLYREVKQGRVRVWQAAKLTAETGSANLSLRAAQWVDDEIAPALTRFSLGRVLKLVRGLIAQADPELAAERAEAARERREVAVVLEPAATVGHLTATVDLVDAVVLNHTISALAHQLAAGEGESESLDIRRAKALGILGTPARALLMLQSSDAYLDGVQAGVDRAAVACPAVDQSMDVGAAGEVAQVATGGAAPTAARRRQVTDGPHSQSGSPATVPSVLWPRTTLVIHCTPASLADPSGVSRIENLGPVVTSQLRSLLADSRVTVRPVVDHTAAPALDRYEIPASVRSAVTNRTPHDAFPYGSTPAGRCDLDHVQPFRGHGGSPPTGDPPQTRADNLTPLSRRAHRAKTHGGWGLRMTPDGYHYWTSPLGRHYLTGSRGTTRHDSIFEAYVQARIYRWRPPPEIGPRGVAGLHMEDAGTVDGG